jgi:aminoglycoside 3-N-acetyltransferase
MTKRSFAELLTSLDVPRGAVLYVQSSADWIALAGWSVRDVFDVLDEWTSDGGTLVMPTYPCRTTHVEYLRGGPVFDVRRTPAAVGLIAETFRRRADAARSLDPDFSISAAGADAAAIVDTDRTERDPFGPQSVYTRLIARNATLVGLGVSLNTNSFIHVVDSALESRYPEPVYEPDLYTATVITPDGARRSVTRRALRPPFQQLTRPSLVAERVADRETFSSVVISDAVFFRWNLPRWADWCLRHAADAAAAGTWPCWLQELAFDSERSRA